MNQTKLSSLSRVSLCDEVPPVPHVRSGSGVVEDLDARDPSLVRQLDVPRVDAEDLPLAPSVVHEDFVQTTGCTAYRTSSVAREIFEMLGSEQQT